MARRRQGEVGRRIARLKLVPFLDAAERIAPDVEWPSLIPEKIVCPIPDHEDRTPSCMVYEDHWHCYGCGRGGDVVDLAQHVLGLELKDAVSRVERALGILGASDERAAAVLALAKADQRSRARGRSDWTTGVREIEAAFARRALPYVRSRDWRVECVSRGAIDHAYDVLDDALHDPPGTTARSVREGLRDLRRWVEGWMRSVERDVERMTGKDRLDVAVQDPGARGDPPTRERPPGVDRACGTASRPPGGSDRPPKKTKKISGAEARSTSGVRLGSG